MHNLNKASPTLRDLESTAREIDDYAEKYLWDPQGVLYSYIDGRTNQPFAHNFITKEIVPRRMQRFDPWEWWTYEDTTYNAGLYLEGLVRQYEVTGESRCMERAGRIWRMCRKIYLGSQVFGIGSFLRPYGGIDGMCDFAEPMGAGCASTLLCGLHRYMKHVDAETRADITDIMLKTLTWYEQQNFQYLAYKSYIRDWSPQWQYAGSYFLPAIAWAAKMTGDPRWQKHLVAGLAKYRDESVALADSDTKFNIYRTFYWGSDLLLLKELLGEQFDRHITPRMIQNGLEMCLEEIRTRYTEPGFVRLVCPESAKPGFKPYFRWDPNPPDWTMGYAYHCTVHGGRNRPRSELFFLCAMAAMGNREALKFAVELMSQRRKVPTDFTDFLFEDQDKLPMEVRLYALSVGAIPLEWFRTYWMLRQAES